MDTRLKLSIIIPAHNVEALLSRCLDSVLKKTASFACECLIVDDGSTDNTLAIAREYESKYPEVRVLSKVNGGVGTARNLGILEARGKYIWFVDSDDHVSDKALPRLAALLERDEEHDVFVFYFGVEDAVTGEKVKMFPGIKKKYDELLPLGTFNAQTCPTIMHTCFYPWNKLFKTDFVRKYDLKFSAAAVVEDMLFVAAAFLVAEKIKIVDVAPLYIYQAGRPGGQSASFWDERRLSITRVCNECDQFIQAHDVSPEAALALRQHQLQLLFYAFSGIDEQYAPQLAAFIDEFMSRFSSEQIRNWLNSDLANEHRLIAHVVDGCARKSGYEKYKEPLLSIIIPEAGPAESLVDYARAIKRQQTLREDFYEIVLSCETSEGADKLASKLTEANMATGIKIAQNSAAQTAGEKYVAGLEAARGRYVCFTDPSITITSEHFKILTRLGLAWNADVVTSHLSVFMREKTSATPLEAADWRNLETIHNIACVRGEYLIYAAFVKPGAVIYKRTALLALESARRLPDFLDKFLLLHLLCLDNKLKIIMAPRVASSVFISVDDIGQIVDSWLAYKKILPDLNFSLNARNTYRLTLAHNLLRMLPFVDKNKIIKNCPRLKMSDLEKYRRFFVGPDRSGKFLYDFFMTRDCRFLAHFTQKTLIPVLNMACTQKVIGKLRELL